MAYEKKSESRRTIKFLVIQVVLAASLAIFVAFAYINSLWS